ncbi:MAG: DUF523 domain-containing protein [Bacillota bacterium]|nr:DUF523 domain-containing protein [Bacillota bacterium]
MKKRALISSCLLGVNCRYDGGNNGLPCEKLKELKEKYELIPVCPECYGGLTTPRTPSERREGKVVSRLGEDVTEEFSRGAEAALYLAELFGAELAILKENSPSCGSGTIYDGSFSGKLTEGDGVTAELLKKHGITVIGEKSI